MTSTPAGAPLRVALLGYGLAGRVFHAPLVTAVPGLRLAAVVTRDPERSTQARADVPGVEVLGSADDVWARASEFDVAVVATTNRTHVPLALAAVDAGLAVVVDKPLATSAADARRLVEAARSAGVVLTTYQNRRWDGDLLTLRRLLADGALGRVWRFESRFERWRPTPKPGWREDRLRRRGRRRAQRPRQPRGGPGDAAVRPRGAGVRRGAAAPRRRPGRRRRVRGPDARERHGQSPARERRGGRPRAAVSGAGGAGGVRQARARRPGGGAAGARPGDPGFGEEPEEAWGRVGADPDWSPVRTERGDYPAFYVALERAVRGEGPVPVDPEDSVRGLEVLEAARRSAAEGAVIRLG